MSQKSSLHELFTKKLVERTERGKNLTTALRRYDELGLHSIAKRLRELMEEDGTIQDGCIYGYVLPDRCRYSSRTGCNCRAYPAIVCGEETLTVINK